MTDIRNAGDEVLGRRHGSEPHATGTTPAASGSRSTQALPTSAERAARITEPSHDRQPQPVAVKLYRSHDLVTVAAPMPGLGPGDIAIVVSPERRLVIVGRLCADADESCGVLKEPNKEVLLDEWEVGPYRREIELPTDVDAEAATVTYGNGILVVALPIAATTRPARLTLENVSTHLRAGRSGAPNRRLGGAPVSLDRNAWRGAALVAGGTLALYLLRRARSGEYPFTTARRAPRFTRGRALLAALAGGTVTSALVKRAVSRFGARDGDADARKPKSPRPAENPVEEASWESFPASDAPSWTGTRARAFD